VGVECVNINECDDPVSCMISDGNEATCTDLDGTYQCDCNEGYLVDQTGVCNDIDECVFVMQHVERAQMMRGRSTAICTENSECINTPGRLF